MEQLTILTRVQAFRDPIGGELSHVQIFINDRSNPFTWYAQLLSKWLCRNPVFSKISSWMWSIRCGLSLFWIVQDRCITGGKSSRFNWATQFWRWHTMVHIHLTFLSEWREYSSVTCLAEKNNTWWELASRCCWNSARRLTFFLSASVTRRDWQFFTWTDPSFQQHYRFRPTTYELRTYQHPLV